MSRLDQFNRLAFQNRLSQPEKMDEMKKQLSHLVRETVDSSSIDQDMLQDASLLKVLSWASSEGRIHLLHELTDPNMGFLWSSQRNPIITKIDPSKARMFSSLRILISFCLSAFLCNNFSRFDCITRQ